MKKRMIICATALVLSCASFISAFAKSNVVVYLPVNQIWSAASLENRTGNYSYVQVGCDSVYPTSGTDNFTKIQARICRNNSGTLQLLMNKSYIVLTEGAGLSKIYIKEGYLNTTTVHFQFRGNSSSAAEAVVDYYAK